MTPKILIWILRGGLFITLFAPFLYDAQFLFPYIVPRAIFFQIITEVLFLIASLLICFFPEYRPRLTSISRALLIFFLVGIVTTLNAFDPSKSFIGTIERSFGLFHHFHFGMLFFAAIIALPTQKAWNIFLTLAVAISIYPSLDFLWDLFSQPGSIHSSVMGNPTFLAAYLLFHLFFAFYLFKQIKSIRFFFILIILLYGATILNTHIRGAFLGLLFGSAYMLICAAKNNLKLRKIALGLLLLIAFTYGTLFIYKEHPLLQENRIISRITNFSSQDATIRSRLSMWTMALSAAKEKPFLGWGRENFSLAFNKYFHSSFEKTGVPEAWEDRTHNIFFDELIHGGLAGLFAYLLILFMAWKAGKKEPALQAGLIAYTTANLFGIDTINTYLPFFIFLALVNQLSIQQIKHETPRYAWLIRAGAATALGLGSIGIFLTLHTLWANTTTHKAMSAMVYDNYPIFERFYQDAKKNFRYFPAMQAEALSILANILMENGQQLAASPNVRLFTGTIIADFEKAQSRNPLEHRLSYSFGQLLEYMGAITKDPTILRKAEIVWEELIAASPKRRIFKEAQQHSKELRKTIKAI